MKQEIQGNNKNWLAFYTRSRTEKQLFTRLSDLDFEVFLPLITRVKQWSDRKKKVQEPLIRSYVFVRIENQNVIEVLKVPGVVGVLKYLGKPAVVREDEIENLKILVNGGESGVESIDSSGIQKGDPIEVIKGPFSGLKAEYVRMKGKYRVIVNIDTLGSVFSVDIPGNNIKIIK